MADKQLNRRRQIIGAVASCASEEGIAGVTLRNVARRMGATTGMLMHYYESRTALLKDTSLAADRSLRDRILDRVGSKPGLDWLLAFFDESFTPSDPGALPWSFWLEYWASAVKDPELGRHCIRRIERLQHEIEKSVHACVEDGTFRAGLDERQVAQMIVTFVHGLGLDASLHGTARSQESRRADFMALLVEFSTGRSAVAPPERR